MKDIPGGITAVRGIRAAGIHCGIKSGDKKDLALIVSEPPGVAAGVFTTNRVKAAPVLVTSRLVHAQRVYGIVANSGNANACTGERGVRDAERMSDLAAGLLGVDKGTILVASTGAIGKYLPMEKIETALPGLVQCLRGDDNGDAAAAILTTDTRPKWVAVETSVGRRRVRVGGIAKGAGMISPQMATMLAFLVTDAHVSVDILEAVLREAVDSSFNRITVDGDTSTNDMVLLLANGLARNGVFGLGTAEYVSFSKAVSHVCTELAKMIVRDGEGATKFVEVRVQRARSRADADRIARAIANSCLVKTALFGNDPNWGRILAAAGYAGVDIDVRLLTLRLGEVVLVKGGQPVEEDVSAAAKQAVSGEEVVIALDLGLGEEEACIWTCDLSYDYVRLNAEYPT